MSVSICCESINNPGSLFYTKFVLDFFKQFQSHCVYKVLIQKSNLNLKEGKQEEAYTDESTTLSDSCSFPWDHLSEGQYVGDKSSERQFSLGTISRGILLGGNYLSGWGNCPGAIIQGQSSSGQLFREQFFLGQLSRGQFPYGAITLGGNHPGGNCLGSTYPGGNFLGAIVQTTSPSNNL